ncbi:very short patch repair endonuclease [Bradyrhizobium japonicum]|uniref:very short patch repair endonuclease n=1 Tax=Bradyrhizobium japonicum TaxID=375 RepID=UPI001B8A09A7|nr:DNA mismatch endonuclease Vsr [Bradyrhizobium japonicum]MBR0974320.1 DNA mismatch endonuclease Vsr [Bradyrhizobium japonicum]
MIDTLTKSQRSARMALVRGKDTGPELVVRRLLHSLGYRYRLHRKGFPGRPDLVFPSRRAVVFVHGCFFHRHPDPHCRLARLPKSRLDFWLPKLEGNRARDERNIHSLISLGWRVLIVWECELADKVELQRRITSFLGPPGPCQNNPRKQR